MFLIVIINSKLSTLDSSLLEVGIHQGTFGLSFLRIVEMCSLNVEPFNLVIEVSDLLLSQLSWLHLYWGWFLSFFDQKFCNLE